MTSEVSGSTIELGIVKDTLHGRQISIISISGFIDASNAQYFQSTVLSLINKDSRHLIVDARRLSRISTAGIGACLGISERLRAMAGEMIICGLDPKILEIFEVLKLPAILNTSADMDEASDRMKKMIAAEDGIPSTETSGFPLIFTCPSCDKKMKAPKPGRFRCLQCQTMITINSSGKITRNSNTQS